MSSILQVVTKDQGESHFITCVILQL